MKRREFIGIAAATAVGRGWLPSAHAEDLGPAALARPRLLGILRNPRAVHALGRQYRTMVPAEADEPALTRALLGAEPAGQDVALASRLEEQVRRDFAEGRTTIVGGWVLALTEARQCALYSLLNA